MAVRLSLFRSPLESASLNFERRRNRGLSALTRPLVERIQQADAPQQGPATAQQFGQTGSPFMSGARGLERTVPFGLNAPTLQPPGLDMRRVATAFAPADVPQRIEPGAPPDWRQQARMQIGGQAARSLSETIKTPQQTEALLKLRDALIGGRISPEDYAASVQITDAAERNVPMALKTLAQASAIRGGVEGTARTQERLRAAGADAGTIQGILAPGSTLAKAFQEGTEQQSRLPSLGGLTGLFSGAGRNEQEQAAFELGRKIAQEGGPTGLKAAAITGFTAGVEPYLTPLPGSEKVSELAGELPFVGGPAERLTAGTLTPLGLAGVAASPAFGGAAGVKNLLAGAAGQLGVGTALEAADAPTWLQYTGEGVAGLGTTFGGRTQIARQLSALRDITSARVAGEVAQEAPLTAAARAEAEAIYERVRARGQLPREIYGSSALGDAADAPVADAPSGVSRQEQIAAGHAPAAGVPFERSPLSRYTRIVAPDAFEEVQRAWDTDLTPAIIKALGVHHELTDDDVLGLLPRAFREGEEEAYLRRMISHTRAYMDSPATTVQAREASDEEFARMLGVTEPPAPAPLARGPMQAEPPAEGLHPYRFRTLDIGEDELVEETIRARTPQEARNIAVREHGGPATLLDDYLRAPVRGADAAVLDDAQPAPARPASSSEAPVRKVAPNERLNPADRDVVMIRLSDIEARPELFQTRDVSVPGEGIGQRRVDELAANWDPDRLTPSRVVRNPEQPGKFILLAGHHRAGAARKVMGEHAEIPAIIKEGDIRDPGFLQRMQLEAVASNFTRAEMNVREQARSVRALMAGGMDLDTTAAQLRMRPALAQDLDDMIRLGDATLDRVVTEPALVPLAAELGRGVRVHGLDIENADALFRRFSQVDTHGRLPTRTAVRQVVDKFAPQLKSMNLPGFDALDGQGRGGILALVDDLTRERAALETQSRQLKAAVKGAEMLGQRTGKGAQAKALTVAGQKEIRAVEKRIKALERDLTGEFRKANDAPTPEAKTPHDTPELIAARRRQDEEIAKKAHVRVENGQTLGDTPARAAFRQQLIRDDLARTTERVGDQEFPIRQGREAYIVLGPPSSGKSTVFVDELVRTKGARVVDSDTYKGPIAHADGHTPTVEEGADGYAMLVHESTDLVWHEVFNGAVVNGDTLALPLIGKTTPKIDNLGKLLSSKGYRVHLISVKMDPEEAAKRAVSRFHSKGRLVPPEYVLSVGRRPEETYATLKGADWVYEYRQFDNEVPRGQPAIEVEAGQGRAQLGAPLPAEALQRPGPELPQPSRGGVEGPQAAPQPAAPVARPSISEVPVERPTGAQTWGETRVAPEFGVKPGGEGFRGEQGGVQPAMFPAERGQGNLFEAAQAPTGGTMQNGAAASVRMDDTWAPRNFRSSFKMDLPEDGIVNGTLEDVRPAASGTGQVGRLRLPNGEVMAIRDTDIISSAERAPVSRVGARVVKDGQEATVVQVGKKGEIVAQTAEGVTLRGKAADFAPPRVVPTGVSGSPSASFAGQDALQKVVAALRTAKKVTPEQEALRTKEIQQRVARAGGAMGQAVGKRRLVAGLGQLKGPQPRVVLEDLAINEADQLQLYEQVHNFYAGKPRTTFTEIQAMQGLETLMLGALPQPNQIGKLEDVFGPELINAFKEATRTGKGRVLDEVLALLSAPRTIMSSFFDVSGVGRQAALVGPGHPQEVYGNVPNYLRYFAREKNFQGAMDALRQHPLYPQAVEDGLSLPGVREASGGAHGAEEAFMSLGERTFVGRLLRAVPGIRATERGYTGFLTKLRWDLYNRFSPGLPPAERADLAKMLNAFTGRGTLGPLEKIAPAMNNIFFAARLQAGRMQAPIMPLLVKSPAVRKLAARDLVAFVGEGALVLGLIKASGVADVELDPRSTDWGKVKLGPTRIDFWGGMQPIARLVAREVSGQTKTSGGDIVGIDRDVALWNFIKSKFAPVPGLVEEIRAGETFIGEPMDWSGGTVGREAQEMVTPLMISGIREAVKESGWGHGLLVGAATAVGWGAMSYTTPAMMRDELFKEKALAGVFGEEYKAAPDYDPGRGDRTLAEGDPELAPLVLAADRENQKRGNEAGVLRASRQQQIGEEQASLRIPELAHAVEAGKPGAPEQFRTAIGELRDTAGDFAARDYFGEDFGSDKANAYRAWADLQNTDFPDDDAFWAEKDRLYAKLPPRLQDAIEAKVTSQDPAARRLERRLNEDRKAIDETGYWDVTDRWFEEFGDAIHERLPSVNSYSDLAAAAGYDQNARAAYRQATRQIGNVREGMRRSDPHLDARLSHWYGMTPMRQDATRRALLELYPGFPLPIPRQD